MPACAGHAMKDPKSRGSVLPALQTGLGQRRSSSGQVGAVRTHIRVSLLPVIITPQRSFVTDATHRANQGQRPSSIPFTTLLRSWPLEGLAFQPLPERWPGLETPRRGSQAATWPGRELDAHRPTWDPLPCPAPSSALSGPCQQPGNRCAAWAQNQVYWRAGGRGTRPRHGAGRRGWGWGSVGEEAPFHRHSGARGHAAPVTQQEEDDVHHVAHLCGRGTGVRAWVAGAALRAFPHPHRGSPVQLQLGSRPTYLQTCPAGYGPAWSWPSGGRSSGSGPWRSSPLWGLLYSRGSVPGRAGVSKAG